MYIFACSSYRTSFILPHKLYTIEKKTKYYPIFEKKIRFEYLDRLISADCKSTGSQFECVCATQNLNIIHRRYVRVQNLTDSPTTTDPQPDFELKDQIEYEMPTHGTLQKICVLTRHLVVIFKEEKTLYTVVFEKWRKYSLQHLTLNFESDELLDCNIDESTLPATDKLYYLNSFKRVYSYNISAPMLKRKLRKMNTTNVKWFSLQDDQNHKDEISLRVKGINSTVVLRLPTSRVHAKTHWKALLLVVLCLAGLVLSRVLAGLWYFTKTKYEFLGKSMLEYEEGTATLYSKPMVHEEEESATYLSFILRD